MSQNPLQQFFRQPKIYINLPSKGIYSREGSVDGNVENLPVFGMTGMDEILIKTPDALYSGESTVKVIESCVPSFKDAWELSNLDLDLVLAAIRIATYGNLMEIGHRCPSCGTENDYDLDLNRLIDHYTNCQFDNKVVLKDLVVRLHPLNYRQITNFSIKNAQIQQRIQYNESIEDAEEKKKATTELFKEIGLLQNEIISENIESVELPTGVVTEREYMREWTQNCDRAIFEAIKDQLNRNKEAWGTPGHQVKCENCGHEATVKVEMDQSSFFASA